MADLLNEKDQLINLEKMFREEKFSEALELAQKVIKEFPDSFQVEFMFARLLRANGKLNEAEEVLSGLLASHDNHLNLLLEMGGLCLDLNKLDPAADFYNRALFIDPFNSQAKEALKTIQERFSRAVKEATGAESESPAPEERKKWKSDTLPEVEIDRLIGDADESEEETPDLQMEDQITADSISIEEEVVREIKPSIPGVDEAYVPEGKVKVETKKEGVPQDVQESLMADPDFIPAKEKVTTDDVADLLAGEPEPEKSDTASTRKAAGSESGDAADTGDDFITESAAQLYVSQGLYEEALYIYEKLNRMHPGDPFADRIQELKSKIICQKKIQALSAFLNIIQKRGG